jgi:hypothetical protein
MRLKKPLTDANEPSAGRPKNLTRRRFLAHKHAMAHVTGLDRKLIISICIR